MTTSGIVITPSLADSAWLSAIPGAPTCIRPGVHLYGFGRLPPDPFVLAGLPL